MGSIQSVSMKAEQIEEEEKKQLEKKKLYEYI